MQQADVVIIGAGAAGLMAGIWAGRTNPNRRIVLLDGANKLGANSGGRRRTLQRHPIRSMPAPTQALRATPSIRCSGASTCRRPFGSSMKSASAETRRSGQAVPVTDSAHTVLNALLDEARGVHFVSNARAASSMLSAWTMLCHRRFMGRNPVRQGCAGDRRCLPKPVLTATATRWSNPQGIPLTPRIFPALVPLICRAIISLFAQRRYRVGNARSTRPVRQKAAILHQLYALHAFWAIGTVCARHQPLLPCGAV